jgi:hypothetical protein
MNRRISRRAVVSAASAVLGLCLTRGASAAEPAAAANKVNEKDSMAVALGYVADAKRVDTKTSPTYQPGSNCSGCSWYHGKAGDPAGGPCSFFPGRSVDANGWCRMWSKKQ